MDSQPVKHKNTLNRGQQRKLEDWLAAHWGEVEKFGWTQEQTALQAGGKLGFPLTPVNVRSAAEVIGKKFPRGLSKRGINRIPRQVLTETVRLTAKLAGEYGVVVPPVIQAFLESDSSNSQA